ncbi:WG repeat-containing protein [Psychrobacter sp. I-STPA10]|uniref:WG repeat-containing protein n=1 Tax=Psychrobacter sp. I-STPA10 TaxID=2585769 RepID=UPI001E350A6A|nr:WG repeat-containing protein [Psychrobacter sp. I-STPA10]
MFITIPRPSFRHILTHYLLSLIIILTAITTIALIPTSSYASIDDHTLQTITINDMNASHPNQLQLQPDQSYYQLIDTNGNILQDELYKVLAFPDGRILAKRDGYWGVIDTTGKLIFDFNYDDITLFANDTYLLGKYEGAIYQTAVVKDNDNWIYPNTKNFAVDTTISHLHSDQTHHIGYFVINKNDKTGLISDQKQMLLPPVYDELTLLNVDANERLFLRVKQGDKIGLIDQNQTIIVPFAKLQSIDKFNFKDDETIFKIEKYAHFFNVDGYLPDDICDKHNEFSETLINANGQTLLVSSTPTKSLNGNLFQYSKLSDQKNNEYNKFGIINSKAEVVLPAKYEQIQSFSGSALLALSNQKIGIITLTASGELSIATYYDSLKPLPIIDPTLTQQLVHNQSQNRNNFHPLLTSTRYLDTPITHQIEYPHDYQLFIAQIEDKYGLVDSQNNVLIPFIYDSISHTEGDLLLVEQQQKYGLLTPQNKAITDIVYDDIAVLNLYQKGSYYLLTKGKQQGIINAEGKQLFPLSDLRFIKPPMNHIFDLAIIEKQGKYGWLNEEMTAIAVAPIYEDIIEPMEIESMDEGLYKVQKDGEIMLITASGNITHRHLEQYAAVVGIYKSDNLRIFDKNDNQGILGADNTIIIPMLYEDIYPIYYENTADDLLDNNSNKSIKPIKFYMVTKQGKYGLLNEAGQTLIAPLYAKMKPYNDATRFIVAQPTATILSTPPNSDQPTAGIQNIDTTLKYGVIDATGKVLLDFEYEKIFYNTVQSNNQLYLFKPDNDRIDVINKDLKIIDSISHKEFAEQFSDYL